jgi:EmrB/QacA subfamily drug resistance transporter
MQNSRTADRRANLILATVMLGAFMSLLDTTIVNVALPSMQHSLHASDSALEWIVSGYALAFGLVLIPAGRLGDSIGRKPLYIAGLAIFLITSLGAGLAANATELVIARVIQGLGAGIYYTQINATILDTFTGADRGRAFGVLAAIIGLSTAIGPLAGGLLIAAAGRHEGWRWIFYVNLVAGLIAIPAAARYLPKPVSRPRTHGDLLGAGLLTAGLLLILFPLIEGRSLGWPIWSYLCFAAAAPVLIGLAIWEKRVEARGARPLIPPRVVYRQTFARGATFALLYFASFTSIFFTLAVVWQDGFRHSALASGLVVTPFAIGAMITARHSARIAARLGRRILPLGCLGVTAGLIALLAVFHASQQPSAWYLVAPLLITGLGHGLIVAPNIDIVLKSVPPSDSGAASGVLNTAQRLGSALGIALVGTALFGTLHISQATRRATAIAFNRSFQYAMLVNISLILATLALAYIQARTSRAPQRTDPTPEPASQPTHLEPIGR